MEMNADMRRRFVLACLALGLIAGLCGWLLLRPDPVSWALSQQMRRGPGATVDFAEIAPFPWDRVYFFGPYTSHDQIQRTLGFAWRDVGKTAIESSKGVNLVVFVRDREVVYWFEHARHEELGALAEPTGFAREQAKFQVSRSGEEQRLALVPQKR
jgi:hypothetical protein